MFLESYQQSQVPQKLVDSFVSQKILIDSTLYVCYLTAEALDPTQHGQSEQLLVYNTKLKLSIMCFWGQTPAYRDESIKCLVFSVVLYLVYIS